MNIAGILTMTIDKNHLHDRSHSLYPLNIAHHDCFRCHNDHDHYHHNQYRKHHHNHCNHQNRFISEALLYDGIWEEGIVTNVLKALELYPVKPLLSSVMSLPSTKKTRTPCSWTLDLTSEFIPCLLRRPDIQLVTIGWFSFCQ